MIVRKVEDTDIPEISDWFKSIKWDLPAVDGALPKEGYVAEKNGSLVACAWLYLTNSSVAFIQWTNTNPLATESDQAEGLSLIIKTIQEAGPKITPPIKSLCIYTRNDKFKDKLKSLSFRSQFGFNQCTWVAKDETKSG